MEELAHHRDLVEMFSLGRNRKTFSYETERLLYNLLLCGSLKVVKFRNCSMSDRLAGPLADFITESCTCVSLDLSHNEFTRAGAQILCEALAANTNMLDFKFTHNPLKNEGIEPIATLLKVSNTIKSIDVSYTGFDATGENYLKEGIVQNRALRTLVYSHIKHKQQAIQKRLQENNLLWREKFSNELKEEHL